MADGTLGYSESSQGTQWKVFSDLLDSLSASSSTWTDKTESLQRFSQTVLCSAEQGLCCSDQQTLRSQLLGVCNECLHSIELLVSSVQEDNVGDNLISMRPLLQFLSQCQSTTVNYLNHILKWTSDDQLHLGMCEQAIVLALTLAKDALEHCQESSTSYGLLFSGLESELLNVFRQSYNSLKVCFSHLEQMTVAKSKSSEHFPALWTCLQDVAAVSVHFDNTLMVKSWRNLLKFYTKFGGEMSDQSVKMDSSLKVLAETVVDRLHACISTLVGDQAAAQTGASPVKVVTFLGNALTSLLQSCTTLDDTSYLVLLDMLLRANSSTAVLYRGKGSDGSSSDTLLTVVKQVTSSILSRLVESWSEILPSLVQLANGGEDGERLLGVLHCTLWFFQHFAHLPGSVRDQLILPSTAEQLESSQFPLLELLFQALPHCQAEFSLSSGSFTGQPSAAAAAAAERQVENGTGGTSLYQHTFDVVCSFAISLSSREFMACLEWGLLQQVVDGWHPVCVLLSQDLFTFLARLGTSSLRVSYVLFLVKLVHSLPASCGSGYRNLLSLGRRLFSTLTEKEMTVALDRLSTVTAEENSVVWALVDFSKLPETKLMQIVTGIVMPAVKYLSFWQQLADCSPAQVVCVLELMANVTADIRCFQAMPPDQRSTLCQLVLLVWRRMTEFICDVNVLPEETSVASHVLLEWTGHMVSIMSVDDVMALLQIYQDHIVGCSHEGIVAGLPQLFSCWGRRTIPDGQKQDDLLDMMGSLCQICLSHSSWRVHQNALVAFTDFAKVTPYAEAVESKFMPADLGDVIVAYLQQVPRHADLVHYRSTENLLAVFKERQQHLMERRHMLDLQTEPSQFLALKAALQNLSSNLGVVSHFLDSTGEPLPDWLSPQLTAAHDSTKLLIEKVASIRECAAVGSQLVLDSEGESDG
ncbi:FIGNL1-interacting regulator of recombination and mitosis-like isoform X2 [Sycon ciliatum]|uniref:FIGNL1-interacting regulator of recombination and mitosis-like isoform X2 n=1 Tax=Sycon ciliatum TaxID=27933 RepID=UPI0031F68FEC